MKRIIVAAIFLAGLLPMGLRAEDERMLEPETLAGTHNVRGRNANGSPYEGEVTIRVKDGLVLLRWEVAGRVSYGTGLVEGMCLGVALDGGVAIYQIVPQAEGKTLVGLWATEGAKKACEELILIGNTDVENASFELEDINGKYRTPGAGWAVITGDGTVKRIQIDGGNVLSEGLALGDGLAVITPQGLSVFNAIKGKKGLVLRGQSVVRDGAVTPEKWTLVP